MAVRSAAAAGVKAGMAKETVRARAAKSLVVVIGGLRAFTLESASPADPRSSNASFNPESGRKLREISHSAPNFAFLRMLNGLPTQSGQSLAVRSARAAFPSV
ncbi:hypothetical protein JCM18382A_60960 [Bradyrhizobium sp. 17-4]